MTDELTPLSSKLAELLRKEREVDLPVNKGAQERLLGMLRVASNLPGPGDGSDGGQGDHGGGDAGSAGGGGDAGSAGRSGGAGSAAMPRAAATWLAPKSLLVATATGVLGFAGGIAVSPAPEAAPPALSAPSVSDSPDAQAPDAASPPDAAAPAAPPDASAAAAPARPTKRARPVVPAPAEPREVAPAPAEPAPAGAPDVQHASERQLIDAARVAINRGRSHDALVFLMGHERRFPEGSFVEERELLVIEALVAQNRVAQASQRGKAFLVRFPRSTHAPRVRSLIGAP